MNTLCLLRLRSEFKKYVLIMHYLLVKIQQYQVTSSQFHTHNYYISVSYQPFFCSLIIIALMFIIICHHITSRGRVMPRSHASNRCTLRTHQCNVCLSMSTYEK